MEENAQNASSNSKQNIQIWLWIM